MCLIRVEVLEPRAKEEMVHGVRVGMLGRWGGGDLGDSKIFWGMPGGISW